MGGDAGVRPPYYKPPKDSCEVCGASLYRRPRYRVRIHLRARPYNDVALRVLVVCEECLAALRSEVRGSRLLSGLFKVRYRRMPTLGGDPASGPRGPGSRPHAGRPSSLQRFSLPGGGRGWMLGSWRRS